MYTVTVNRSYDRAFIFRWEWRAVSYPPGYGKALTKKSAFRAGWRHYKRYSSVSTRRLHTRMLRADRSAETRYKDASDL